MVKENCEHDCEHEALALKARAHMPSEEDLARACNVFRVLAEPSRMRIVLALKEGELCVYHIVEACGGTQSAVSHQLRVLKDNRVIKCRRDGQNMLYSLADEHIMKILEMSEEHLGCGREEK